MNEDPAIVEMNVAHYRALLKLDMPDERRSAVKRLLAQALEDMCRRRSPGAAADRNGAADCQ